MKRSNRVLITGAVASFAIGAACGYAGTLLTAPFYFGFFFGFVMTGLITMFWLAAVIAGEGPK